MGLDPSRACIGYRWENERVNAPVHQLLNAADWTNCLENGIGMQSRARTRTVICVIRNLNLPEETAPATSSARSTATAKKRKSSASSPDGKKTFDFTQEYRQLKKHLECAMHKASCAACLMAATIKRLIGSTHLSGPRKLCTIGNASLDRPPENIMFQEFFLPTPKRARNTRDTHIDSSTNPCAPTIHVTVNTGTSTGSSRPDTEIHASGFDDVRYPSVMEVLQMIDDSGLFADSGVLDFPVVVFADDLAQYQITHVDHVPILETSFYIEVVNMPAALAELLVEESIAAMGRAQKGKGRM
ncbi:hypothetical protein B0H11DRAFT_2229922 [Mycena galericulata]|nr:hypothetical protein B0H11DRAFT_2229922 [Mycena galericulata]